MGARRLAALWRRYWFPDAPLVDLAAMRVVVTAIVLALTTHLEGGVSRYLRAALVPPELWAPLPIVALLSPVPPSPTALLWLGRLTLCATVLALSGVATRAALLSLFPLLLVQEAWLNCAGKTTHGTIALVYAVLFLALSPCDRALALGPAVAKRWRAHSAPAGEPSATASRLARWPQDLLYFEISSFYLLAGIAKLRASGLAWADGSTLQYHLLTAGGAMAQTVASHPWLCAWLSGLALSFELLAPLGMMRSLRGSVLCAGLAFHVGTAVLLDVSFLPLVALYAVFVPWRSMWVRVAGRGRT